MDGCQKEFEFVLEFAESEDIDIPVVMQQLRALWTSLCVRHDIQVDTSSYDNKMLELWNTVEGNLCNPYEPFEYERFYNAMSRYLI